MQPAVDQFGNYQSSQAGNGIYVGATGLILTWVKGNFAGGQPTFTPISDGFGAMDTSNGQLWEWFGGAWSEVSGGSGSPQNVTRGHYAGGAPSASVSQFVLAVDEDTNNLWSSNGSTWSQLL